MVRKILITAASAVAMSVAVMPSAHAGSASCVFAYVNDGSEPQLVNCHLDAIGNCTIYYDPLHQFPDYASSETIEYPLCLAL